MINKSNLQITHPEIAQIAHGWDPSEVTYGSRKIKKWKCNKGHIYTAQVRNVVVGTRCSYCSNRKVLIGFNDLLFTHPEIARQLQGIDPKTVTIGSKRTAVWKCSKGHIWKAQICNRKHSGCGVCNRSNLKRGNTRIKAFTKSKLEEDPEICKWLVDKNNSILTSGSRKVVEWKCIKKHVFKYRVQDFVLRRVCPICSGNKVMKGVNDLATLFPNLAAEAYGWDPTTKGKASRGFVKWKCSKGHIFKAQIHDRTRQRRRGKEVTQSGSCSYCSNKKVLKGFNDLKTTHPELCVNLILGDPETVTAGSEKVFTWICAKGHEFRYQIFRRTGAGSGCQICDGTVVLAGFNDLKTLYPDLCKEIVIGDPETVTAHTDKQFTWQCKKGHKYRARISTRTREERPSGCPKCANTGFSSIDDGWLYLLRHESWELLQIGITNSPKQRIKQHSKRGWEMLDLRGPMKGDLTRQIEIDLLRFLRKLNLLLDQKGYGNRFDGYTESWFDAEYPIKNLQTLIELSDKSK